MSSPDDLADRWRHVVVIEPLTGGDDGYGGTFATGVTLLGFVKDNAKLVRNPAGDQVVSSTQVALPAGSPASPAGSRVTLPAVFGLVAGQPRRSLVIGVSVADGAGLPTPDHVVLYLE